MTRIKELLKERNLTQKEFAEMLGISPVGLYQQLKAPSYPTLQKWSAVLHVPIWQLFVSPEEVKTEDNDFKTVCPHCGKKIHVHLTTDND